VTVTFGYVLLLALGVFLGGLLLGFWAERGIKKPAQKRLERATITRALSDRHLTPVEVHQSILQDGIDLTYEEVAEILRSLYSTNYLHRKAVPDPAKVNSPTLWAYYLPTTPKRLV